jgi:hypothetical protein
MVPSLHSNLADVASASGSMFCCVVACCGAGTCATGFWGKAQPAHESEISKTAFIRIRVDSEKPDRGRKRWLSPTPTNRSQATEYIAASPDSDIAGRRGRVRLTSDTITKMRLEGGLIVARLSWMAQRP